MSNSPDDPRLIPGHPEFVKRPEQPWLKTVAKQLLEIEKLKRELAAMQSAYRAMADGSNKDVATAAARMVRESGAVEALETAYRCSKSATNDLELNTLQEAVRAALANLKRLT